MVHEKKIEAIIHQSKFAEVKNALQSAKVEFFYILQNY